VFCLKDTDGLEEMCSFSTVPRNRLCHNTSQRCQRRTFHSIIKIISVQKVGSHYAENGRNVLELHDVSLINQAPQKAARRNAYLRDRNSNSLSVPLDNPMLHCIAAQKRGICRQKCSLAHDGLEKIVWEALTRPSFALLYSPIFSFRLWITAR
jgi:hypothetical protein